METERALLAETVEFSLRATEDLMEGHMPEPAVRRESNEDDDAALASIPATFCDAFTVSSWEGHVRLSLGEFLGDKLHYRVAVVMPVEDVRELITYLERAVKRASTIGKESTGPIASEST